MVGPVLAVELLRGSRRGRQHVVRWAYAGLLLAEFGVFSLLYLDRSVRINPWAPPGWVGNPSPVSALASSFLALLVVQQFLLLVLALPAFTAGAVTEEKARGTLQDLLTTELTPWGIVAGKLLGQFVRVVDLSLPGWLLLAVIAALGGLEPAQLLALAGGLLAPLPALGAAGLLASVWCRRTTNAALAVYGAAALGGALFWGLGRLTAPSGPLYFVRLVSDNPGPAPLLRELLAGWLAWGGLTVPLLALAAWRLRPAYRRQLAGGARRAGWVGSRPPVGDHPVRWKEQYVERVLDLPGLRLVPRWLGVGAVFVLTLVWPLAIVRTYLPPGRVFALQGLVVLFLFSLAAGARASGAVCGERERQTWEALLLTPLTPKQLLRSKLWGALNLFRPYLLAYLVPAVALAAVAGGGALVWTAALWVLTVVFMYYMAACGIACSVRATSSWKSWLSTLLVSYRGLLSYFLLVGLPAGVLVGAIFWVAVAAVVQGLGGGPRYVVAVMVWVTGFLLVLPCLITAVLLFARAEQLLVEAEKQLGQTERIPQRRGVPPAAVRKAGALPPV